MRIGKLNWDELNYIINDHKGKKRKEVEISNGIGEDCAVVDFGGSKCVISTDPITGATENIGKLAVNINCNDIASCGVEPLGLLVTILAPPSTELKELHDIMEEIHLEAVKMGAQIIGGHTEVTDAVNRIIVSCTALGKSNVNIPISTAGASEGDSIIVTKNLCLEGTAILVNDYRERCSQVLTEEEIKEATSYIDMISVVKEGIIGGQCSVSSMHDITEGGVLGALWEVATASNSGFIVSKKEIPLTEVSKKVCEEFKVDPLRLISSGSMLMTTGEPEFLLLKLKEAGIKGTVIGKIVNSGGWIKENGELKEVMPPEADELFNIK